MRRSAVQRARSAGASFVEAPALRRWRPALSLLLLGMILEPAPRLAAQQPAARCPSPTSVSGRVRSARDGGAVVGASVVFPRAQLRVLTDGEGRFTAAGLCPGPTEVSVSHLAFGTTTLRATVEPGASLDIRLTPRAIPLEGILVEVEPVLRLLERRRMAVAASSGVFNAADFELEELPASIPEYVAARTGHPLYACGRTIIDGRNCFPYRGGTSEVSVCLDSAPLLGGVPTLELWPQSDIARVEFYPGLALMKVFTKRFLVLAAEKPWLLQGMWDDC